MFTLFSKLFIKAMPGCPRKVDRLYLFSLKFLFLCGDFRREAIEDSSHPFICRGNCRSFLVIFAHKKVILNPVEVVGYCGRVSHG
jgi:hypothetical protein